MDLLFLLPRRCLRCGTVSPHGPLCRSCQARYGASAEFDLGWGHCPICGQVRLAESGYCVDCSVQSWTFPVLEGLFGYQEPGGELLRLYKFGGLSSFAEPWARGAAARLVPPGPLIPVPPLRKNLWKRGWDPVDTFTEALGRQSGLPVWRVLIRRPSASQKTLCRPERVENARQAYGLTPRLPPRISQTPVVWLVDDVVTTGATVEACSRLLRQAGVAEVRVLCLGLH